MSGSLKRLYKEDYKASNNFPLFAWQDGKGLKVSKGEYSQDQELNEVIQVTQLQH